MSDKKLTLVEHLSEFRARLIKSIVFILLSACLLYSYIDALLPALIKPIGKLVFIAPQEAFIANIKIAFFGGLFLSSPFVLYQVWQFISTGLERNERKYALIFGLFSFVVFILGSAFGWFVIIPIGISFLLGFATDFTTPMITMSNYISFIGVLTFAFGAIFQLPLIILFLTKIGVVTPQFLSSKRRHAIVLIFILGATLTPPDVITQCLMAVPLLVLYEAGVIISRFAYRKS